MAFGILKNRSGFTYIAALMIVVVMGIMLGVAGQSWKMIMQREKEEELIFRGRQIRDAIVKRKKQKTPGMHVFTPLNDLQHLVKDPRVPQTVRYLRKVYKDPITGEDFKVIRDQQNGIVGVFSPSDEKTIKVANFPLDLKEFEAKEKYSEWQFFDRKLFPAVPAPPKSIKTGPVS